VNATWDKYRYTVGASADDAGVGNLDVRRVIAVNPGGWSGDLRMFFEQHYPGVDVISVNVATPGELERWFGGKDVRDPDPVDAVQVGLHDEAGGRWMVEQGLPGCCLVHWCVQREMRPRDVRYLANAGVTVVARVNWGYAGGTGTLPRVGADREAHVEAVVTTILNSRGVGYWQVGGNEPNNRQEWPGFDTAEEYPLTVEGVVEFYNEVWRRVVAVAPGIRIGPPALDPYFGPGSDNGEWWRYVLGNITDADVLFLHVKSQTNAPGEVWSRDRFEHDPLRWQYLNVRVMETYLGMVPERFKGLPVYVTELNPQHLYQSGGALGWRANNGEWVREAMRYVREWNAGGGQRVEGVMFYRFEEAGEQAMFGLARKGEILEAIRREGMGI